MTPWTAAHQTPLCFIISWSLLKIMSIDNPLSSPSPPAFNLFQHQGLSNESALHIRWPKCWSFSFSISPSNEYTKLISFRIGWFYLLAVQRTLNSLLQHHNSKASILWHSAFFVVQLFKVSGLQIAISAASLSCQTLIGNEWNWSFSDEGGGGQNWEIRLGLLQ